MMFRFVLCYLKYTPIAYLAKLWVSHCCVTATQDQAKFMPSFQSACLLVNITVKNSHTTAIQVPLKIFSRTTGGTRTLG